MNVKKTSVMINSYSKFENRILTLSVAILIALAFAISSAKAAGVEKADLAMVNEKSNVWRLQSPDGSGTFSAIQWGLDGDVRVPADFDGDGAKDLAVWRPSNGTWYILGSRSSQITQVQWGLTTPYPTGGIEDVPAPADFDGDKIADLAVWRPVNGKWYVLTSKSGFTSSIVVEWGIYGDIPVPADYDGDGRTDVAVFRSMQNRWLIAASKTGNLLSEEFGISGDDLLVPADYTGDGRADIAIYRAGTWHIIDSATGEFEQFQFGYPDAKPVPADYNGDGTTDYAFFRRGMWYIYESGEPRLRVVKFGGAGEVPLNSHSVKASLVAVR